MQWETLTGVGGGREAPGWGYKDGLCAEQGLESWMYR